MEITIMRFNGAENSQPRDYLNLLLANEYTENRGVGFKELNIEEDGSISGLVLKKTPVFINVLNPDTQTIIQREEFIVSEVDFSIDTINRLIEIYAPVKDVKKLINTFRQTVDNEIRLEQLTIKPSTILKALKEEDESCEISKLHIKDFSSEEGIIGSYDIKSVETDLAWELVNEYKNDVVKATVSVEDGSVGALVQIFQNGKFRITTKPRNNTDFVLTIIKNLISKNTQK